MVTVTVWLALSSVTDTSARFTVMAAGFQVRTTSSGRAAPSWSSKEAEGASAACAGESGGSRLHPDRMRRRRLLSKPSRGAALERIFMVRMSFL